MCRFVELVALGPELRRLAEGKGKGAIEAHFLVHEVLAKAFVEPLPIPSEDLLDHLTSQMERKLVDLAGGSQREPRIALTPGIWRDGAEVRRKKLMRRMANRNEQAIAPN